jgi:hypothetical protein
MSFCQFRKTFLHNTSDISWHGSFQFEILRKLPHIVELLGFFLFGCVLSFYLRLKLLVLFEPFQGFFVRALCWIFNRHNPSDISVRVSCLPVHLFGLLWRCEVEVGV